MKVSWTGLGWKFRARNSELPTLQMPLAGGDKKPSKATSLHAENLKHQAKNQLYKDQNAVEPCWTKLQIKIKQIYTMVSFWSNVCLVQLDQLWQGSLRPCVWTLISMGWTYLFFDEFNPPKNFKFDPQRPHILKVQASSNNKKIYI